MSPVLCDSEENSTPHDEKAQEMVLNKWCCDKNWVKVWFSLILH